MLQFPDPHFKRKHRKRRVVQEQLVRELAQLLRPGGRVFVQSDVEEVSNMSSVVMSLLVLLQCWTCRWRRLVGKRGLYPEGCL